MPDDLFITCAFVEYERAYSIIILNVENLELPHGMGGARVLNLVRLILRKVK